MTHYSTIICPAPPEFCFRYTPEKNDAEDAKAANERLDWLTFNHPNQEDYDNMIEGDACDYPGCTTVWDIIERLKVGEAFAVLVCDDDLVDLPQRIYDNCVHKPFTVPNVDYTVVQYKSGGVAYIARDMSEISEEVEYTVYYSGDVDYVPRVNVYDPTVLGYCDSGDDADEEPSTPVRNIAEDEIVD